jgi:hypothetical protein
MIRACDQTFAAIRGDATSSDARDSYGQKL